MQRGSQGDQKGKTDKGMGDGPVAETLFQRHRQPKQRTTYFRSRQVNVRHQREQHSQTPSNGADFVFEGRRAAQVQRRSKGGVGSG